MSDVLVVDDDEDMVEAVAEVLRSHGYTVRTGVDGSDGLRLLDKRLPNVLVLDVDMPELTGPEMARRMLILDAGRERIPILLLSGVADLESVAAFVGTPYALAKPCSLSALLNLVNRALTEQIAPSPRLGAAAATS
jgi:FixJ family two-component response regulator